MKITLVNSFARPFDNAVAAARTCYAAGGVVTAEQVAGLHLDDPAKQQRAAERKHALAASVYEAGHHTTLQHAHLQFAMEGVSRQFIWSFLHSHPFYNSEQVSQRYVSVSPDQVYLPEGLTPAQRSFYLAAVGRRMDDYNRLCEALTPLVGDAYGALFPARADRPRGVKDIQKKAQEVARYVLPVGVTAYLYHTISLLTLLRYRRMMDHFDTPTEQRRVVEEMVRQVVALDPDIEPLLEEPLPIEATREYQLRAEMAASSRPKDFCDTFDAELAGRTSKLIDWSANAETTLARAVREVLGLSRLQLSDDDAIKQVLDPSVNGLLGETLNLKGHGKLARTLVHPHYSFAKKLSHTADSQDQRHRMTPASRPVLAAHLHSDPDYITPPLLQEAPELEALYHDAMSSAWEDMAELSRLGASADDVQYLLPNAVSVRFTESGDLAALHHKMAMRLCYNAQEEIWAASLDEAEQIRAVHPRIGGYLLPPCGLRDLAKVRPVCPEGDRYCGVKVWRLDLKEYTRRI